MLSTNHLTYTHDRIYRSMLHNNVDILSRDLPDIAMTASCRTYASHIIKALLQCVAITESPLVVNCLKSMQAFAKLPSPEHLPPVDKLDSR